LKKKNKSAANRLGNGKDCATFRIDKSKKIPNQQQQIRDFIFLKN